jgi:hypothetical protein
VPNELGAFYYEERLPNQVFKIPFQNIFACDFDKAMGYSFWSELKRLANLAGDSFILMAVLDPHPVEYYYKEFSQYNWCILTNGTTADEYWNTIEQGSEESPADAILFNSEVVVWLSPSMKWAIWGERSYGICIIGFNYEINGFTSELLTTIDTAITDMVSLNFRNNVPVIISSSLIKNYKK